MRARRGRAGGAAVRACLIAAAAAAAAAAGPLRPARAPGPPAPAPAPQEFVQVLTVTVPAAGGWLDTGLDVERGRVYRFQAEGRITLQTGNPVAGCGPAGLDIRTRQQPLLDQNLGCLIAKIARLISVRVDEETGQEVRDEIVRLFPVGPEAVIASPLSGRLYLGPNENMVQDNEGGYSVAIFRRTGD